MKKGIVLIVLGLFLACSFMGCGGGGGGHHSSASSTDTGGADSTTGTGQAIPSTLTLVANDSDGNVTMQGTSIDVTLSATTPADTKIEYVINAQPAHGTLAVKSDGVFTYSPNTSFTGSDFFTFHVTDGKNVSNVAQCNVKVVPDCTITAVGGKGDNNIGGSGGGIKVDSFRNLTVKKTGSFDTSFDAPQVTEDLGATPYTVDDDVDVHLNPPVAKLGELYVLSGDQNLHLMTAAGAVAVSGLKIINGKTLTLPANDASGSVCNLTFTNDVWVVNGKIRTMAINLSTNDQVDLNLTAGRVLVNKDGKIDLSGNIGNLLVPYGGRGGNLTITTTFAAVGLNPPEPGFVLHGSLITSGGVGDYEGNGDYDCPGGDAGNITVVGFTSPIYVVSGNIHADGGAGKSTTGSGKAGGLGGNILITNAGFDIKASGSITAIGGYAERGDAGNGGTIQCAVGTTQLFANFIGCASFDVSGGNSDYMGKGGNAGLCNISAVAGNLTLAGEILANGGDGNGLDRTQGLLIKGGLGGAIFLNAIAAPPTGPALLQTGLLKVGADMHADGGYGWNNGSNGGTITIETSFAVNDIAPSHNVTLVGYHKMDASGGDGSEQAGAGGSVALNTWQKIANSSIYEPGPIVNEADIYTRGGSSILGLGGNGGAVQMITYNLFAPTVTTGISTIKNSGTVDISDGNGGVGITPVQRILILTYIAPGQGIPTNASFTIYGLGDVENKGKITAKGGDAIHQDFTYKYGGTGGDIRIESAKGNASNLNDIDAMGGTVLDGNGLGGNGGYMQLKADAVATNTGDLNFESGAPGGLGGLVWIDSQDSVYAGSTISVADGGTIKIDGDFYASIP